MNYSHTTYLDTNEPDLRQAKSVEEAVSNIHVNQHNYVVDTVKSH